MFTYFFTICYNNFISYKKLKDLSKMMATALRVNKGKITRKLYINDTTLYIIQSKTNYSKEVFYHSIFTLSTIALFTFSTLF